MVDGVVFSPPNLKKKQMMIRILHLEDKLNCFLPILKKEQIKPTLGVEERLVRQAVQKVEDMSEALVMKVVVEDGEKVMYDSVDQRPAEGMVDQEVERR